MRECILHEVTWTGYCLEVGPFTPLLTKLEQRLKCFLVTLLGGCEVYLTTLVPGFWDWLALDDVKGKQRFQLGLGLMSYGEEDL